MDNISEARIKLICPPVADVVRRLVIILAGQGVDIHVVQALRSYAQQQKLYDQGRVDPGAIVTRCKPGWSWHNFGLAVDVAPFDPLPDWNLEHPQWKQMERVAASLGFVCGATFRTFPDHPHLQMTGRFPVNPNDEARKLFTTGGLQAVWNASGLIHPYKSLAGTPIATPKP